MVSKTDSFGGYDQNKSFRNEWIICMNCVTVDNSTRDGWQKYLKLARLLWPKPIAWCKWWSHTKKRSALKSRSADKIELTETNFTRSTSVWHCALEKYNATTETRDKTKSLAYFSSVVLFKQRLTLSQSVSNIAMLSSYVLFLVAFRYFALIK